MYLAVDVGGTKTLVASFTKAGKLKESLKFPTPKDYKQFLASFEHTLEQLDDQEFSACCIAIPGVLDREQDMVIDLGNLPWKKVFVTKDISKILGIPVVMENDAKLAGLYEAVTVAKKYDNVVYLTLGTGVGLARINKGVVDTGFGDHGGHSMPMTHHGKRTTWEKLASGKAISKRYGKKASDIKDEKTWREISHFIGRGLIEIIALFEPGVVVVGGGVGAHFDRFGELLKAELKKYETPMTKMPRLLAAKKPEEAVIYGCYEYLKAHHG